MPTATETERRVVGGAVVRSDLTRLTSKFTCKCRISSETKMMHSNPASSIENGSALSTDNDLPFGTLTPQTFFVQQNKPAPMAPLQVWRGYKGNIYFQPISIKQISPTELTCSRKVRTRPTLPLSQPPSRATTAGQLTKPYSCNNSSSQVFILDRQSVLNSLSDHVHDELRYIEGVESTGSLAVRPVSSASQLIHCTRKTAERSSLDTKSKICKGTNFHTFKKAKNNHGFSKVDHLSSSAADRKQLFYLASASSADQKKTAVKQGPNLLISGGRISSKYFTSSFGRKTTPSHYNYPRATMNTPDLCESYEDTPFVDNVTDNQQELNVSY